MASDPLIQPIQGGQYNRLADAAESDGCVPWPYLSLRGFRCEFKELVPLVSLPHLSPFPLAVVAVVALSLATQSLVSSISISLSRT
jgi:hypothetical protein